MIRIEL